MSEWTVDDEVLRLVESIKEYGGVNTGFVGASLGISDDEALACLQRLEARRLLRSGMLKTSGGTWRCWAVVTA